MLKDVLLSPPILFAAILLGGALFFLGCSKFAARGKPLSGKREPYACGEDMKIYSVKLPYHAFFRLALLFGILHIVALVITTHPADLPGRITAAIYITAAFISMLILFEREYHA